MSFPFAGGRLSGILGLTSTAARGAQCPPPVVASESSRASPDPHASSDVDRSLSSLPGTLGGRAGLALAASTCLASVPAPQPGRGTRVHRTHPGTRLRASNGVRESLLFFFWVSEDAPGPRARGRFGRRAPRAAREPAPLTTGSRRSLPERLPRRPCARRSARPSKGGSAASEARTGSPASSSTFRAPSGRPPVLRRPGASSGPTEAHAARPRPPPIPADLNAP